MTNLKEQCVKSYKLCTLTLTELKQQSVTKVSGKSQI